MQQNEKIGFIGVGLMGHGMAKNILRAGYPVTVIAHKNRVPVENLLSLGAQEAGIRARFQPVQGWQEEGDGPRSCS